jgi:MFS transporter, DHA1 family, multidrug resistance protein
MIIQEPILALMTAYMSFLYGILYLLFEAYPVSFQEQRGWKPGVGSLPFAAFIVGIMMGTGLIAYSTRTNFTKAYKKHGHVVPEERLPPMIVGAAVLPIGLFMFAWTSNPNITWVPQVLATALLGMGCLVTFWQGVSFTRSSIFIANFCRSTTSSTVTASTLTAQLPSTHSSAR